MPFDQEMKGDPFRGDYPGQPGHDAWDAVEARAQRDVIALTQRRHQPAVLREHRRLLHQRRQAPAAADAPQPGEQDGGFGACATSGVGAAPAETGADTLLVPGELLITGHSYDGRRPDGEPRPGPGAKGYLDSIGVDADDLGCPELRARVLRLTPRDPMSAQELADLAATLRAQGMTSSVNHVTTTASIMKGEGSPEPAAPLPGPPDFGDGKAAPAKVAIIDTGRDGQRRSDGWLRGVTGDVDPLSRFPVRQPDPYLDLAAGHGTFVAGIIEQVAPRARIQVYRAVDSDGVGTEVTVACQMIKAVTVDGAQIINLSLGFQTHDGLPPLAIQAALEVIRDWERETGREVLIVAAAGNYGDAVPCWPAAFRQVVSVGALAPDGRPAPWSTHGFWVTCSAIGQGVRSTYVEGRESPLLDPAPAQFGPDAWAVWSGTSFTAPQIVGAVARLHEQEGWPLREALDRLLAAGRPAPGFGQALKILPGS